MATVGAPRTEVRAQARYVRTAPRKAQLVAEQIRGRPVPEARTILAFLTRDAARDVERVLSSAVANAEANHGLVGDDLVVSSAYVGAGPVIKRWRARARGRVARIRKRTCHITIGLAPVEGEIPAPSAPAPAAPPRPAEPEEGTSESATGEAPARSSRRSERPETEEPEEAPKPRRTRRRKTEEKPEEAS